MKDVIERVNKYLTEYARFNGNDKECIHTLQAGSDREATLLVDDIRLLVSLGMETGHVCAMLKQTRDEIDGLQRIVYDVPAVKEPGDWTIDDALCARQIMNMFGYSDNPSLEPGADERREKVAKVIAAHADRWRVTNEPTPGYLQMMAHDNNAMTGPVMVSSKNDDCTVTHIIPPGWQLVPQEPTLAMLDEIKINDSFTVRALLTRYEAMLSNAPQPPKSSFLIRQSRDDAKDPDCPFCGGSGHKDDIPPQVVDGDVVKHLRRMAANSQSVLYSHRTVLANAASEIESFRARLPEIRIAVDNLVYQEIRYVAVSAGPVSSSNPVNIIKEAETILNNRRKILNDLLTT